MKIFICCSKAFYPQVEAVKRTLEAAGHTITLPNSFDNPGREDEVRAVSAKAHSSWKAEMIREQNRKIEANDAILVLNLEKDGQPNYIGGATFLEIFKAFEMNRKIFLLNPIPDNILRDELLGMEPLVINGDLALIG
ncbi:MAG TPA: hypothetical protein VLF41_01710 [Candidatus Nanoarchaeia archaeon]|nr:hypothetical protein [Candidatus Nanoarchaeia archaeon]